MVLHSIDTELYHRYYTIYSYIISLKHSSITFAQVPTTVMVLMGALVLYGPGYLMMLNFPKPKTAGGNDSDGFLILLIYAAISPVPPLLSSAQVIHLQ